MSSYRRPRPITTTDDVSTFSCGEPTLDAWLTTRAIVNERDGNSRTFVTVERETGLIAGYYCLSAHSVTRAEMPRAVRRNSPERVPVILIGRLAVDKRFHGHGVGASLLADALAKGLEAAERIGSRAFLVDALSDSAAAFSRKFGFTPMPGSARALYVTMADARATVGAVADT